MRKAEDSANSAFKIPLLFITYGLIGVFIGLAFLLLFSAIISKELVPEGIAQILAIISVGAGALVSGYLAAKAMGRALISSMIQGLVNFALEYAMGTLVFMRVLPVENNLYVFLANMLLSLLGGFITAVAKPGRRRHI